MKERSPDELLPLPTAWFHILVALAGAELHGYAIMQDIVARTGGKFKIGPGTLYTALKRLTGEGLAKECDGPPGSPEGDERRRYYRLTPFGRTVALAEMHRMSSLLRQAKVLQRGV